MFILLFLLRLSLSCITKPCFDWKLGCIKGRSGEQARMETVGRDWAKVLRKTTGAQVARAAGVKCCFLRRALEERTQLWVGHTLVQQLPGCLFPVLPFYLQSLELPLLLPPDVGFGLREFQAGCSSPCHLPVLSAGNFSFKSRILRGKSIPWLQNGMNQTYL